MEAIGQNLRRLRSAKGLTQAQLADVAGLSRPGYRAIENGDSVPGADTLQALADALDVGIEALVQPVRTLRATRFRSTKKMRMREQILADVARWLDNFKQLEELLEEHVECPWPDLQNAVPRDGDDAAVSAAVITREAFGLDDQPIRDICGLLDSKGVKVFPISLATDTFFGLSVSADDGGPAVVVNTWERISVERWIFTAAHELGHLLLHLDAYDVEATVEQEREGREANVFASHFLMPQNVFAREWSETHGMSLWDRVLKVKRMFGVSYRTVLYRLAETEIGNEVWPIFQAQSRKRTGRTLLKEDEPQRLAVDAFKASFPESRRAGEPERLSPIDFTEDRLPSLVRKAVESGAITLARGAEILGLGLREMRDLAASWAG